MTRWTKINKEETTSEYAQGRLRKSPPRQLLWGLLLGLVLVPTILVWVAVGTAFFGYRAVSAYGTSMEPSLRSGDALWEKQLDATDIKVGDILTLCPLARGQ